MIIDAFQSAHADIIELDSWMRALRRDQPKLRTYESKGRSALRLAGIALPNGHGTPREADVWHAYRQQYPDAPAELHQFGVLCAQHNEGPHEVNQSAIDRYAEHAIKIQQRPRRSVLTSTRRLVAHFKRNPTPNMGINGLKVPGVKARAIRPPLSSALVADITAWVEFRIKGSKKFKPAAASTAKTDGDVLTYLAYEVTPLKALTTLADLVDSKVLKVAFRAMDQRLKAGGEADGRSTMAYDAACTTCKVSRSEFFSARGYEFVTTEVVEELNRLRAGLSPKRRDLRRPLRNKLRHFCDPNKVRKLLNLPLEVAPPRLADQLLLAGQRHLLEAAFALQCCIELPAFPSIIANLPLAAIELSEGGAAVYLSPRCEGDRPAASLSPVAVALHDRYLSEVRAVHKNAGAPWLFLGRGDGVAVSPQWFRVRLSKLISSHFEGIHLSVLELRVVLAFIVLARDANARDLAARYLGHERRAALEALVKQVTEWRRGGALKRLEANTKESAHDRELLDFRG
jgi:hypothetical protein